MAALADKTKMREHVRRVFEFIFGFENRRGDVLTSWIFPVEGLSLQPQDFYGQVESELASRKIPSMKVSRERFAEGGLLSSNRVYLRLMRERFAIDTCAAPFGSVFFFSCRTVHVPSLVRLWHIVAAFGLFFLAFVFLIIPLGFLFASIALVTLVFALAAVLRNATADGFCELDEILLRIPLISTIYEDWFRQETYYREDTRTLYTQILPALIKELAEHVCAEKGVKLDKNFKWPGETAPFPSPLFKPKPGAEA